jgi:hypothetical protein
VTTFYLGTHRVPWLLHLDVPLMVSVHQLNRYRRRGDDFPKADTRWAMDSGGFTEISTHGEWTIDPDIFGGMVYRLIDDLGRPPDFVSIQDWMCEDDALHRTGLTTRIHQQLTTESAVYLRAEFPHAPWMLVLQGQQPEDYLQHAADYSAAGFDLASEPIVGLGSVCRRQATSEIVAIVDALAPLGLRLHGFGLKKTGLTRCGHRFASADSLAWSYQARKQRIRLDGCTHLGVCNNCPVWARQWRTGVMTAIATAHSRSNAAQGSTDDAFERSGDAAA